MCGLESASFSRCFDSGGRGGGLPLGRAGHNQYTLVVGARKHHSWCPGLHQAWCSHPAHSETSQAPDVPHLAGGGDRSGATELVAGWDQRARLCGSRVRKRAGTHMLRLLQPCHRVTQPPRGSEPWLVRPYRPLQRGLCAVYICCSASTRAGTGVLEALPPSVWLRSLLGERGAWSALFPGIRPPQVLSWPERSCLKLREQSSRLYSDTKALLV